MPLHVRIDGEIAVLSDLGRLMNDPRYVDAAGAVDDLLDRGHRAFVVELAGVREAGAPFLGLLTTLTRRVRARGGEVVLAAVGEGLREYLDAMRMEDYWDVAPSVEDARGLFPGRPD